MYRLRVKRYCMWRLFRLILSLCWPTPHNWIILNGTAKIANFTMRAVFSLRETKIFKSHSHWRSIYDFLDNSVYATREMNKRRKKQNASKISLARKIRLKAWFFEYRAKVRRASENEMKNNSFLTRCFISRIILFVNIFAARASEKYIYIYIWSIL
jgi:hypothetical protein